MSMHIRDWLRSLPPFELPSGKTNYESVCQEAQPAVVARAFFTSKNRRFLVLAPTYERALAWEAKLSLFGVPEGAILHLPTGLGTLFDDAPPELRSLSDRARALGGLLSGDRIVIASPNAALERTMAPDEFSRASTRVKIEDEIEVDALLRGLVNLGYENEEPVRRPGTFSRRGGIVDIFPAGAVFPYRIEFFGDFVESLRTFDPESQRSVVKAKELALNPVRAVVPRADKALAEKLISAANGQSLKLGPEAGEMLRDSVAGDADAIASGHYFDRLEIYIPQLIHGRSCALDFVAKGHVFIDEPLEIQTVFERSVEDLDAALANRHSRGEILSLSASDLLLDLSRVGEAANLAAFSALGSAPEWMPKANCVPLDISSLGPYRGRAEALGQAIANWAEAGIAIIAATDQPSRARHVLGDLDLQIEAERLLERAAPNTAVLLAGNLAGGFVWPEINSAVLTDAELFGVGRLRLPQRRFREGAPIATVLDLKPGDYVVHIQYGVGIYRGLTTREVEGRQKEYLSIEYQAPDRLLVPSEQLDRIQKFLSPGDSPPSVHRITGAEWQRYIKAAKKGAEDLARELLKVYAQRAQVTRPPFGEDSPWQREMEAGFPWVETKSQMKAINEVKSDLDKPHPMDRLVCGDVGFGKTEVAVRAAFKVVQSGKQVAVLCPTTILADQHFETFRERLAAYPVRISLLNRFRSPKQREATIRGLADGSVDIVIGTHALLQKKIQYKNLGLVIVDEEQRFGVKHKEFLKAMRANADFLTLTATPIPRTLSMSLMELRPMSIIDDPPPGRLPIRTYLRPYGEDVVREAILRELARGGQVFYVYNRVEGIEHLAEKIRKLAPNARIAVGHGQMTAEELEPVMSAFFHGEIDVLISTTIVENGIDNANANTLIVDGADRLGLAQLYQIRGRVGRGDRQAYAYLLYRSGKKLTDAAVARLNALQEFSHLGSGYSLAFRDLQIRGAGELLGAKQHGTMQTVGYSLYTQLVEDAIKQLKIAFDEGGESAARLSPVDFDKGVEFHPLPDFDLPAEAYLPNSYIEDENQRLFFYKKLMDARDEAAVADVETELADRYGPLPAEAASAAKLVRLRIVAQGIGVQKISGRFSRMTVYFAKGKELPLAVVHKLAKGKRPGVQKPDRIEWDYGKEPLASVESLFTLLGTLKEEAAAARAARAARL
jgi:transcription-repair coupling factor (superfamily II helicase)